MAACARRSSSAAASSGERSRSSIRHRLAVLPDRRRRAEPAVQRIGQVVAELVVEPVVRRQPPRLATSRLRRLPRGRLQPPHRPARPPRPGGPAHAASRARRPSARHGRAPRSDVRRRRAAARRPAGRAAAACSRRVARLRPTRAATSETESPNASTSAAYPRASSTALRSSRATFSTSASSSESRSSARRTSAGTDASPAWRAARSRRSPAMSSYVPSPRSRTTIGCSRPSAAMERASPSSASTSNARPRLPRIRGDAVERQVDQAGPRRVGVDEREQPAPEPPRRPGPAGLASHARPPPWPPDSTRPRRASAGRRS